MRIPLTLLLLSLAWGCSEPAPPPAEQAAKRIRPWSENPWYWEYGGEPVLLLGGSDDDNPFQWDDDELRAQLDLHAAAGGNYLRNTMSDRQDKGFEQYPFDLNPEARFDLNTWNPEYWRRFERFLEWTAERDIIVQIELWDRFDYTDNNGANRWQIHPLNPRNNVNYSYEESGYAEEYPDHPGRNQQPFFFSTPAQRNNEVILGYQTRFIDKVLSYTLRHGHVLYCMDNETSGEAAWGEFWANYVKRRAAEAGAEVYVTEMWDAWDLKSEEHRRTMDHPELYDFVDVSQNNHNKGDEHWENFLYVKDYLSGKPRPVNTVKTYGADDNKFGHNDNDAIERFFRHILAGAASARFHRPPSGLGLNEKAQAALKAARAMEAIVPAWELEAAPELLSGREEAEAYAAAAADGSAAVVYFTDGGEVSLEAPAGEHELRWIDVSTGEAGETQAVTSTGSVPLTAPSPGHWLAVTRATAAGRGAVR